MEILARYAAVSSRLHPSLDQSVFAPYDPSTLLNTTEDACVVSDVSHQGSVDAVPCPPRRKRIRTAPHSRSGQPEDSVSTE